MSSPDVQSQTPRVFVGILMPPAMAVAIDKLAAERQAACARKITRSAIIRAALAQYLQGAAEMSALPDAPQ